MNMRVLLPVVAVFMVVSVVKLVEPVDEEPPVRYFFENKVGLDDMDDELLVELVPKVDVLFIDMIF